MKILNILLVAAGLSLAACNSEVKKDHEHDTNDKTEVNEGKEDGEHKHAKVQTTVKLDNGKKWKANPETITGVNNMLALVENGMAGKMTTRNLYDTLKVEFKMIFDKCTMTGESHDQLHNYLLPLKDRMDKLKEDGANDNDLKEMQEYLLIFKNYFE